MATILKVKGNQITLRKLEKTENGMEIGEPETLTAGDDVKVFKGVFKKELKKFVADEPIEDALKRFDKLRAQKVVFITVEDKKIVEILLPDFSTVNPPRPFPAVITKVEGNKVTLFRIKKGEKGPEKGDMETMIAADNVKVVKGVFNKEEKKFEEGEPLESGLKNEIFNTSKRLCHILVQKGYIVEIKVGPDYRKLRKQKDE
jgi:hypothetical protein